MDPVSALVTTLAAGAGAALKEAAGDAVKTAYNNLKALIGHRLSSLGNLEEEPDDADYQNAARKELERKALANDPDIVAKSAELARVMEQEALNRPSAGDIDISRIRAAGDVLVRNLRSLQGGIRVADVTAGTGSVRIEGISAGSVAKN